MEEKAIFLVVLVNTRLISEISFTKNEQNKDELILTKPFEIEGTTLKPYLNEYTNQTIFYLSPTKIITLAKPNATLQEKYLKMTKE
jgi:hypothetical protein